MNKDSDRVYYFIEGQALFNFESGSFKVNQGDVLFVPARTPYSMDGRFRAVLVNSPAFDISNEVRLE